MKKLIFTFFAIVAASVAFGQIVVQNDITSNTTWTANNVYELKAFVYVTNNATLTIEPGTVILGDFATKGTLIITRGSKINAVGTAEKPIVFTSNQAAGSRTRGSWGGVIILGNAKINSAGGEGVIEGGLDANKGKYGGNNDADNSGKLSYVRIEYAGIPFQPNQEINSLTLGGVGSETQIDHIMVTEANDDSYEWFGGTVNGKYMIANRGWDDDFDCDAGFSGKIQFGIVYRDPAIADPGSGSSSAFEHDNDGGGTTATPQTKPVFSNMTVIGPLETLTSSINPNYKRAAQLRRNSATSIFNSAIVGYPVGIFIDGAASGTNATNGDMAFKNNVIGGMATSNYSSNSALDIDLWAATPAFNNSTIVNPNDLALEDAYNLNNPNLLPKSTSDLVSGADFTDTKLGGGFFTTTTFRGAIDPNNDWTECWCKWNPQNEDYSKGIDYTATSDFTISQATTGAAMVSVTNASSSNVTTYEWNFGDPNSTSDIFTTANPAPYTYTSNGVYNITLTVRNGNCPPKVTTKTVNVSSIASPVVVIAGDITANTSWTADKVYELKNIVYVTNNSTLTIEKGTVIKGDAATKGTLIVTRGSKLMAVGTKTEPIVFTSNQAAGSRTRGSWGGVVLLGNARINASGGTAIIEGGVDPIKGEYGGTVDTDNSGHLEYVRIEYAGVPFQPNQELNSLTLGGVGSGTTLRYIQVTEANDDSYEWFGGTVDAKYIIANRGWDDDFDCDFGYSGRVQFGIIVRDPAIADPGSGSSSAFEHDNDGAGSTATPQTKPVFSNITVVGPLETLTSTINPNYKRAAQLRRNSATSIFNSAIVGYPNGIFIDGAASGTNATNGDMGFKNNIVGGMSSDNFLSNSSFDINAWATTTGFNNSTVVNPNDIELKDAYNANGSIRSFVPNATSPLISGASFADAKLGGGFFTTTTYRGAIDPNNDWTGCWTKWDPQNENYNTAVKYLAADAQASFQKTAGVVTFSNTSTNAESYFWDFGDGNTSTAKDPVHTYTVSGDYTVKLKTISGCGSDSITLQVDDVVTSVFATVRKVEAKVYPNPAQNTVNVEFDMATAENVNVTISDITGKVIMDAYQAENAFGTQNVRINTTNLNTGVYFINIVTPTSMGTSKVVIIK